MKQRESGIHSMSRLKALNAAGLELPKILAVDDRVENLLTLEVLLRDVPCTLIKATSGREALQYLETDEVALVLLDVQMPIMDGFEVAERMRANPNSSLTPILFLTAIDNSHDHILRAYELGGADFLFKPIESKILLSKVAVFLELFQSRKLLAQQLKDQAEKDQRVVEEKYRDLVESIDHAIIWSADPATMKFSFVSPRTRFITGYAVEKWYEEPNFFFNRIPEEDQPLVKALFHAASEGRIDSGVDHRFIHADGSTLWLHTGARHAKRGGGGNEFEIRGLSVDVTKFKNVEAQLLEANESKSRFLANMSHEIRTPMTAVLGFTELLRQSDFTESEKMDAISRIERSGRTLLRLIDDILDISKIDSGKLSIEKVPFSPLEIVSEVVALLELQAEQKGITLKFNIDSSVPEVAESDPTRLRQILMNLIGNAVKFTNEGGVQVDVTAEANRYLIFDVRDTGIGISHSDQVKLFQPFAQADESITRQFGGTGLGLILSRRVTEQLGGNLVLEKSVIGEGSRFVAKIDARPFNAINKTAEARELARETARKAAAALPSLQGTRVLVAEDVPDNQVLMRRYLESAGAKVDFAGNGEEAVNKATSRGYDVVLMDIQMPEVDGIQATKRLRASGYSKPILALTAHAMREEVARSLDAGCNEHLTKPITKALLIETVSRFASRKAD